MGSAMLSLDNINETLQDVCDPPGGVVYQYNLYQKSKCHKLENLGLDSGKPKDIVYRTLLHQQVNRLSEKKLNSLLSEFVKQNKYSWLTQLKELGSSSLGYLDKPATLQKVMSLTNSNFLKYEADFPSTKKNRLEEIKETLLQMLLLFSMHYEANCDDMKFTKPSYEDVVASLLSVYVDLEILTGKDYTEEELTEKGREATRRVCLLLARWPSHQLDLLLQISHFSRPSAKYILQFLIRKVLLQQPKQGCFTSYTNYMCAVRQLKQCLLPDLASSMAEFVSGVPAPKHYLQWLRSNDPSVLDLLPETKHFKGVRITHFLYNEAEDEVFQKLLAILINIHEGGEEQAVDDKPETTTNDQSGEISNSDVPYFLDKSADKNVASIVQDEFESEAVSDKEEDMQVITSQDNTNINGGGDLAQDTSDDILRRTAATLDSVIAGDENDSDTLETKNRQVSHKDNVKSIKKKTKSKAEIQDSESEESDEDVSNNDSSSDYENIKNEDEDAKIEKSKSLSDPSFIHNKKEDKFNKDEEKSENEEEIAKNDEKNSDHNKEKLGVENDEDISSVAENGSSDAKNDNDRDIEYSKNCEEVESRCDSSDAAGIEDSVADNDKKSQKKSQENSSESKEQTSPSRKRSSSSRKQLSPSRKQSSTDKFQSSPRVELPPGNSQMQSPSSDKMSSSTNRATPAKKQPASSETSSPAGNLSSPAKNCASEKMPSPKNMAQSLQSTNATKKMTRTAVKNIAAEKSPNRTKDSDLDSLIFIDRTPTHILGITRIKTREESDRKSAKKIRPRDSLASDITSGGEDGKLESVKKSSTRSRQRDSITSNLTSNGEEGKTEARRTRRRDSSSGAEMEYKSRSMIGTLRDVISEGKHVKKARRQGSLGNNVASDPEMERESEIAKDAEVQKSTIENKSELRRRGQQDRVASSSVRTDADSETPLTPRRSSRRRTISSMSIESDSSRIRTRGTSISEVKEEDDMVSKLPVSPKSTRKSTSRRCSMPANLKTPLPQDTATPNKAIRMPRVELLRVEANNSPRRRSLPVMMESGDEDDSPSVRRSTRIRKQHSDESQLTPKKAKV